MAFTEQGVAMLSSVLRSNRAIQQALGLPEVKTAMAAIAVEPRGTTPEAYRELIARDSARWKAVATAASIKLE